MRRCARDFWGVRNSRFWDFWVRKFCKYFFRSFIRMTTRSGKVYCDSMINKQTRPFKKYCSCSSLLSFNSFCVLVRLQNLKYGICGFHFGPGDFFGF